MSFDIFLPSEYCALTIYILTLIVGFIRNTHPHIHAVISNYLEQHSEKNTDTGEEHPLMFTSNIRVKNMILLLWHGYLKQKG